MLGANYCGQLILASPRLVVTPAGTGGGGGLGTCRLGGYVLGAGCVITEAPPPPVFTGGGGLGTCRLGGYVLAAGCIVTDEIPPVPPTPESEGFSGGGSGAERRRRRNRQIIETVIAAYIVSRYRN